MEGGVYLLCALAALGCGVLLLNGFRRTSQRLLLWCGIFFLLMTLENVILFVDVILVPHMDLSNFRRTIPLTGLILLLYGLIWEVR